MAATAPIETAVLTLGELFDRGTFAVPVHQRPWSWDKDNVDRLMSDVDETCDKFYSRDSKGRWRRQPGVTELPHFLGAFVVLDEQKMSIHGSPVLEIVDGQQRITGLVMIAAATREALATLTLTGTARKRQHSELSELVARWLTTPNEPRLRLDQEFDHFFQQYTVESLASINRKMVMKGHAPRGMRRFAHEWPVMNELRVAQDRITKWVMSRLARAGDEQGQLSWLSALTETLRDEVQILFVSVTEYIYGLEVFRSLNSTGRRLDDADNLKNELFRRSNRAEAADIREAYVQTLLDLPRRDVNTFLRVRQASRFGPTPMRQLFSKVVENELKPATSMRAVVHAWRTQASFVRSLEEPEGKWSEPGIVRALVGIRSIEVTYTWILLLAARERFLPDKPKEFEKVCRLALNFAFRMIAVKESSRVAPLDDAFTRCAELLRRNKPVSEVAKLLRSRNSDVEFERDFTYYSPTTTARSYVLVELERSLRGDTTWEPPPIGHDAPVDIEHILPERLTGAPTGSWANWLDAQGVPIEGYKKNTRRLGNLVLLEKDINSKLNSLDFTAKANGDFPPGLELCDGQPRPSYSDSQFELPRRLSSRKLTTWDQSAIDDWQRSLATEALKIWKL